MPTVKFTSPEEFCADLKRDEATLHRRIVRCTNLIQPSRMSPNIRVLTVVATYAVRNATGRITDIVKLERYCGDLWGVGEGQDDKVLKEAEAIQDKIKKVCDSLNVEVRAGLLE
jgi:hypothetical protein